MKDLRDALKDFILEVASTAKSYEVDPLDLEKFYSYEDPIRIGAAYSKQRSFTIKCRGVATRQEKNQEGSESPGEFYKNSILGIIRDLPVYNGNCEWIDWDSFKGSVDFSPKQIPLSDRCLGDPSSIVFGAEASIASELKYVQNLEFSRFCNEVKYEAFGKDSYCRIQSLVDMVRRCYAETGRKVLVIELGPGFGYWINKAGSILNLLGVPFHVLSLEYYYFNAVNTLRMAKYFGNNGKITSVMSDIHDFDWGRALRDFKPVSECSIVVHSSLCLGYVNSQTLDDLLSELCAFRLYGGCHYESDAFTLYDLGQKKSFLDVCLQQNRDTIPYPMPPLGMDESIRKKAGISPVSYLDPSFKSSIVTSLEKLSKSQPLSVKTFFPWEPFTLSPNHYTEWVLMRN